MEWIWERSTLHDIVEEQLIQRLSKVKMNELGDVLATLSINGRYLEYLPDEFKKHKLVVSTAVERNGYALQFAHPNLRKNDQIVLTAIMADGGAIQFADDSLRKDKTLVRLAVRKLSSHIQYAAKSIRKDKGFIMELICDGHQNVFTHIHPTLKDDAEVAFAAVKRNPKLLEFVSDRLRNEDDKIVLTAIASNGETLRWAGEKYRKNREHVLLARKTYSDAIQFADQSLQNDIDLIIEFTTWTCEYKRTRDKEFMLRAVQKQGRYLRFATRELRRNVEIALAAVEQDPTALQYVLFNQVPKPYPRMIVMSAVTRNGMVFRDCPFRNSCDIALAAVTENGLALEYGTGKVQYNKEIALRAVKQNPAAYKFVNDYLKNDKEILLAIGVRYDFQKSGLKRDLRVYFV